MIAPTTPATPRGTCTRPLAVTIRDPSTLQICRILRALQVPMFPILPTDSKDGMVRVAGTVTG